MAQRIQITTTGVKRFLNKYTPEKAIAEYIWNGFDAGAKTVSIDYDANETIGNITEIRVKDDGAGIDHSKLNVKFKPFLDSEKFVNNKTQRQSSVQHGKNGVGRLTFYKFANRAEWSTTYKDSKSSELKNYEIVAENVQLDQYVATEPVTTAKNTTGTTVTITGIHSLTESELSTQVLNYLVREFCWFLELHKEQKFKIILQGKELNYTDFVLDYDEFDIEYKSTKTKFKVRFVQWADNLNEEYSKFYYVQSDLKEKFKEYTSLNKKGDSFFHSVFIHSNYFDNFNAKLEADSGQQSLDGAHSKSDDEYKFLRDELSKYLKQKRNPYLEKYSEKLILEYENEGVLPKYKDNDELGVFKKNNLEQTVKALYQVEPKLFTQLNIEQKKTFVRFINLALESGNRESLFEILKEVIELDDEERNKLANMLQDIKLSNILKTIHLLDERSKTIDDLSELIFNKELGANEVDHLQKVIESNYWIFGEQYTLVTSAEPKFEKALKRQRELITKEKDDSLTVNHSDAQKEMDIFLCRQRLLGYSDEDPKIENVVAELKAPTVSLGKKELDQVEKYLRVIKNVPEFNSDNHTWTFILVGNKFSKAQDEASSYIQDKIDNNKASGSHVALYDDKNGYVVYAKTWSTIFSEFKVRHNFIYDKLVIERKTLEEERALDVEKIVSDTRSRSSSLNDDKKWNSNEGIADLKKSFATKAV